MQSLLWYWRRFQAMSPREMGWRLGSGLQQSVDRLAAPIRRRPAHLARIAEGNGESLRVRAEPVGAHFPAVAGLSDAVPELHRWRDAVAAKAEHVRRNRVTLFDLKDHDLGEEIDWNYEYGAGKKGPMGFSPGIDYRDFDVTGDCKLIWELNRHHQLVILGRAYRLTGNVNFARAVVDSLDSWIRQCPFGMGMNWRSPLELAVRLINWVWALELIRPSGVVDPGFMSRVLPVVYRHVWDIARKYSRFSSANNHLVGEAAGAFIASSYFTSLKRAADWRRQSRDILLQQIVRQVHDDGGHCELAMGYQLFVLELFLLAGLVARSGGEDFPPAYWQRLENMFDFVAAFAEGGETLPMFGDCDDGYVLDLGGRSEPGRGLLAVAAVLFNRSDFKALAGHFCEPAYWLLGQSGRDRFEGIDTPGAQRSLCSRGFARSGYYLLQCGSARENDRISVTFDCGDLGFGSIGAHGHADALSFTLRAFGSDVFVDPGTFDYFTHRTWRDYFRSTRAHNTIVVDDQDQSEMQGPFLWGRRARTRCVRWAPSGDGGTVIGEHDGYARLADPVIHRRTITHHGRQSLVTVLDELTGEDRHEAAMYLHPAVHCRITQVGHNRFRVDCGRGIVLADIDPRMDVRFVRGADDPIGGWVSRGYHRKEPSTTLVARCTWSGNLNVETRFRIETQNA